MILAYCAVVSKGAVGVGEVFTAVLVRFLTFLFSYLCPASQLQGAGNSFISDMLLLVFHEIGKQLAKMLESGIK